MFRFFYAMLEGTKAALTAIKVNAMRSALTCLGIIIGVAAVVTVVAVLQGFTKQINDQLSDMSPDVTTIKAYTPLEKEMLGQFSQLTYDDFLTLKGKVKEAETVTALMYSRRFSGGVQYQGKNHHTRVIGTEKDYTTAYRTFTQSGRFLRENDDLKRRKVAVIGETLIEKLNLPSEPVGEFIQLGSEWFRIIGVLEQKGELFGFDQDDIIYIPISTMSQMEGNDPNLSVQIMFRLKPGADETQITNTMTRILRQRHKLKDGEADDFEFETAEKTRSNFDKFTTSATAITGGIVGISLLVGGIGVMNIMLVSVTERTRVIGTLKALGAPPGFIMLQFLVEAVVLSLFGGLIGLAVGFGVAAFISAIVPSMPSAYVPGWAVMLSFGFTSFIGILFGLAPAVKAARLDPIEALRYE